MPSAGLKRCESGSQNLMRSTCWRKNDWRKNNGRTNAGVFSKRHLKRRFRSVQSASFGNTKSAKSEKIENASSARLKESVNAKTVSGEIVRKLSRKKKKPDYGRKRNIERVKKPLA